MSKKNIFYAFGLITLLLLTSAAKAFAQAETAEQAEKAFAEKDFALAKKLFTQSYESGFFTEKMLYRLAWLEEQDANYPLAIYYLRKINQEFGGKLVEDKIRYLVQQAGGRNLYSAGAWDGFIHFVNAWTWILWGLFFLAGGFLLFLLFAGSKLNEKIRSPLLVISVLLFLPCSGILVVRNFMIPQRAVIIQPTLYFSEPGYASFRKENALAPGETVNITGKQDIWVRVQAGPEVWWVPEMVIKTL